MVLTFAEDGGVRVVDSPEEAIAECEGIDVQSGVFQFFDELGRPLLPVFDVAPSERRFLWVVTGVDSGRYHLEPCTVVESAHGDPLWMLLLEADYLEPNPYFANLDELVSDFRARGVVVDPPTD